VGGRGFLGLVIGEGQPEPYVKPRLLAAQEIYVYVTPLPTQRPQCVKWGVCEKFWVIGVIGGFGGVLPLVKSLVFLVDFSGIRWIRPG
jgi:hypothetical protein